MSPKEKANTERINVFLNKEHLAELKMEADKKGTSVSGLVRMIVIEHLDEKK